MFQEARLIPTLTVKENLLYALNSEQRKNKLDDLNKLIQMVGLRGEENSFPNELSGGMESRVSLIRAFLVDSDTLLMDEPLRSLDLVTKQKILLEMKAILSEYPRTVILVSHDPRECVYLADRIMVLSGSPACVVLDEKVSKDMTESEISAFENNLVSAIRD
jgi:sulfonate transport system ATP-binding protein